MGLAHSLGVSWTHCAQASSLPKAASRAKCPPGLSSKKALMAQGSALDLPKGDHPPHWTATRVLQEGITHTV